RSAPTRTWIHRRPPRPDLDRNGGAHRLHQRHHPHPLRRTRPSGRRGPGTETLHSTAANRPRRQGRRMPLARLSKTTRLDRSPPRQPLATRPRRNQHRQRHPSLPTPPPTASRQPLGNHPARCRLLADPTTRNRPGPHRPPDAIEECRSTRPPRQPVSMTPAPGPPPPSSTPPSPGPQVYQTRPKR
ncbi:MAG: hypothetical protein QOK46_927, partial [Microbacteriaceae bacterium]|nr:hypothetical protein [Microbacteriaceae bacterium]